MSSLLVWSLQWETSHSQSVKRIWRRMQTPREADMHFRRNQSEGAVEKRRRSNGVRICSLSMPVMFLHNQLYSKWELLLLYSSQIIHIYKEQRGVKRRHGISAQHPNQHTTPLPTLSAPLQETPFLYFYTQHRQFRWWKRAQRVSDGILNNFAWFFKVKELHLLWSV